LFAIIDIETTGNSYRFGKITEIAIYHHNGYEITDSFHSLVYPEMDIPYAELWIGAHPKAPSVIKIDSGEYRLDELIKEYPSEILGGYVSSKFGNKLPYLLKVLSSRKSLSIQAHPDKKLADVMLFNSDLPQIDWGLRDPGFTGTTRERYISALRAADAGDFGPLLSYIDV